MEYPRDEHAQPQGGPYPLVHEGGDDHPQEWTVLEHAGTGTPGLLTVEWDPVKDEVRSDGPIVYDNPPHAPAP